MTHTTTINGIRYTWQPGHKTTSLYDVPIEPTSLIPDGMVMTLRNRRDERLVIRGERHGDRIVFIHIGGEGGNREIGAWVKTEFQFEEGDSPTPDWAMRLRARLAKDFGGRK